MENEDVHPEEKASRVDSFTAPWGREVQLQHIAHESGMNLLRVRIKEGRARFTILDLDAATAERWGRAMTDWAAANK